MQIDDGTKIIIKSDHQLTITSTMCSATATNKPRWQNYLRQPHPLAGSRPIHFLLALLLAADLIGSATCRTTISTIADPNLVSGQALKQDNHHQAVGQLPDRPPIQLGNSNSLGNFKSEPSKLYPTSSASNQMQQQCNLGNDSYQLGERWNPNLPPFGVQVCVLCECIARQDKRKNCYEAKVTCRRITNECPRIDSCPDGKRPVTIAGQCCKSCQSASSYSDSAPSLGETTAATQPPKGSWLASTEPTTTIIISLQTTTTTTTTSSPPLGGQFSYKNERVKEYQAMFKSLPACQRREEASDKHPMPPSGGRPGKGKKPNDLNGIDSRLAFKSLDQQNNQYQSSSHDKGRSQTNRPMDETMRQDHQHPNDVQSGAAGLQQHNDESRFATSLETSTTSPSPSAAGSLASTRRPPQMNSSANWSASDSCMLGTEVYEVGDKWNPVLPQLGVQVCVLCNCMIRLRKGGCYEAKVTCRRINNDCPTIEVCPNGKKPVAAPGQCCKSCQYNVEINAGVITNSSSSPSPPTTTTPEMMQKNDTIMREYQSIMRAYQACNKPREGEKHNNNNNGTSTVKRSFNSRKRRGGKE